MWGRGLDWSGGGQGQVAGTCEYGNELSGPIKCRECLDQLQNQLTSQEGLCSMEQVSKQFTQFRKAEFLFHVTVSYLVNEVPVSYGPVSLAPY